MKISTDLRVALLVLTVLCFPAQLLAQLSQGGVPYTFSRAIPPDSGNVVVVDAPSPDSFASENQKSSTAFSFAVNMPVDISSSTSGRWSTTPDGANVWRVSVKSPGALALTLYFDRFIIPGQGRLFVYNTSRTQLLGAFTALNNNAKSTFATSLIHGDELTIEYNAPDGTALPELHISEMAYAYRGVRDFSNLKTGFGVSGPCEVNVNCEEGQSWIQQKRGITRIQIKRTGQIDVWCTGTLINNVRNDGTPYILTADHCGRYSSDTDISQWIFYFNYEANGCPDPAHEPALYSLTGATMIAHGGNAGASGSDFFLVKLNDRVPYLYNVYFNGWSRQTNPPSPSGVSIHHPEADIKKISTYNEALKPVVWPGGSKLAHWQVKWINTPNGHGVTEGGSSGSPLFDNRGRLVGTLTGGDTSCDSVKINLDDYYGMFSYSWDQNGTDPTEMLKPWLDPDNTNVMSLNGWAVGVPETAGSEWIRIFPNPVFAQLTIRKEQVANKTMHVRLFDIFGSLRYENIWSDDPGTEVQIDMTPFASGVYILRINDDGREVVRKVVKE
jgi:hypothetical protein